MKAFRNGLYLVGALLLLGGVGTLIYGTFVLRPKVAALTDHTQALLKLASQPTSAASVARDGGAFIAGVPDALDGVRGVLHQGSRASASGGKSAEKTKEGIAGIVLPKKEIEKSSVALRSTAHQMRDLGGAVENLRGVSVSLAQSSQALAGEVQKALPQAQSEASALSQAVAALDMPTHAMLASWGVGGLGCLLGILSLLAGNALRESVAVAASVPQARDQRRLA